MSVLVLKVGASDGFVNVHNAHSVGETGAGLPSGNDDKGVTALDESTRLSELDGELNTVVNVLHPVGINGL